MVMTATDDDADVRPVPPPWHQLADLVEGARQRGWTEQQCEYLTAVIGVSYAKGFRAGQQSKNETRNP